LRLDHVGGFLDGANLLGPFFVERDFELLFQRHHDFDGVQRIGAQVDKLGIRGDGVEVGAELLGDDTSNLVESVARLFIKGRRKERERVDESQYGVTLESFVNSIQNKRWRKKNVPQRR
jgi:hypothetical protein